MFLQPGFLSPVLAAPLSGASGDSPRPVTQEGLPRLDSTWQLGRQRLVISPEYSKLTGASLGLTLAGPFSSQAAWGVLLTAGAQKQELLGNIGFEFGERHRILLSLDQLRQKLDYGFASGNEKARLTQNGAAFSYQYLLGQGILNALEFNAWGARTGSRELGDKTYAVDSDSAYELWNDHRRIAGGRVFGSQARLVLVPAEGSQLKLGLGSEQLRYDLLSGRETTRRLTSSFEWNQQLANGLAFKLLANTASAQDRYALELSKVLGQNQRLGFAYAAIHNRQGGKRDQQLRLDYTWLFGAASASPALLAARPLAAVEGGESPAGEARSREIWARGLVDLVATRPSGLPAQVVARVDNSVTPTRLVVVSKAGLPAGSQIDKASAVLTVPLGVPPVAISSVTRNAQAYSQSGAFSLSGTLLRIDPKALPQPAAGTPDNYLVSIANTDGSTTQASVVTSHGSVRIDSVTLSTLAAAGDTTPPTTTAAPAISTAATTSAVSVSQTINEAGTGYYLMLPAAAATPTVAQVKAGTSFAMSANSPAVVSITGLAASTAYKYYFVARDATGNDQAAVSAGLAITTAALATPPTLGNVPDQSVTSGNAITPINLASYASLTEGDAITGYRIASGSLPSGVTLVGATISGTPAASGSFSVQAQDRDGWSNADAVTITVSGPSLPATPGSLALVTDSGDSASDKLTNDGHVSWATVSGATSYEVSHNGTSWADVGTATAYDFTSVLAQGSNTVYVRAKNGLGVSATPASLSVSFDSAPPSLTGEGLGMSGKYETGSGSVSFSENISNTHSSYSFVYFVGQAPAGGSLSASATGSTVSLNYTTPNITSGQDVQIKCVVADEAGNTVTLYTSDYTLY